jgi:hypothetical protein
MAEEGAVMVYRPAQAASGRPDLALLERVLEGCTPFD